MSASNRRRSMKPIDVTRTGEVAVTPAGERDFSIRYSQITRTYTLDWWLATIQTSPAFRVVYY